MLVADLDHFKAINDEHGHAKGDEVLAAAAERIRSTLRPLDALYRVGGEEFLVILEGVDETAAGNIAERVRAAFHRQALAGMPVTVSLGVAALAPGQPFEYDGLFASADAALLAAKAAGRDGVMAHAEAQAAARGVARGASAPPAPRVRSRKYSFSLIVRSSSCWWPGRAPA